MRRALRWTAIGLGALVALLVLVVAGLWITTAGPSDRDGWVLLDDMPDPRGEVAAAVVDGDLIVAGGLRGISTTSRAVSLLTDGRWSRVDVLPEPRHHAAAAALDGWLYLSGGAGSVGDWTPLTNLWRYRPGSRWEVVSELPSGRQGHDMVALGSSLYIVGGDGGDATLIFDPLRGWSTGAAIPEPRDHLKAVAWESEVWAIGGRPGSAPTARVDVYDPRSDSWRRGPDLPEPMSAMVVAVVGDTLHVVGGEDPGMLGGVIDVHVSLREGASAWEEAPLPPLAVHGAGGGVIDGAMVVAGGASRQGAFSVLSWTGVTQLFG